MTEVECRELELMDALDQLGDFVLQQQYVMSFANKLAVLPEDERTQERKLSGCTAQAWLAVEPNDAAALDIRGWSDSLIVRGLMGAVAEMVRGIPACDIASWQPRFMHETRVGRQIVYQRKHGLGSLIDRIIEAATA